MRKLTVRGDEKAHNNTQLNTNMIKLNKRYAAVGLCLCICCPLRQSARTRSWLILQLTSPHGAPLYMSRIPLQLNGYHTPLWFPFPALRHAPARRSRRTHQLASHHNYMKSKSRFKSMQEVYPTFRCSLPEYLHQKHTRAS